MSRGFSARTAVQCSVQPRSPLRESDDPRDCCSDQRSRGGCAPKNQHTFKSAPGILTLTNGPSSARQQSPAARPQPPLLPAPRHGWRIHLARRKPGRHRSRKRSLEAHPSYSPGQMDINHDGQLRRTRRALLLYERPTAVAIGCRVTSLARPPQAPSPWRRSKTCAASTTSTSWPTSFASARL